MRYSSSRERRAPANSTGPHPPFNMFVICSIPKRCSESLTRPRLNCHGGHSDRARLGSGWADLGDDRLRKQALLALAVTVVKRLENPVSFDAQLRDVTLSFLWVGLLTDLDLRPQVCYPMRS